MENIMAFTLQIQSKKLLGKVNFNLEKMVKNCNLEYGSSNSFYVLEEGKTKEGTAIIYNPSRIGRGIFIDYSKADKGNLELSFNIPTSGSEIHDFIQVVKEIVSQMRRVSMYCVEEERVYSVQDLEATEERLKAFCLERLNKFCQNKDYVSFMFTLAMWPVTLQEEDVKRFSSCSQLAEFESYIHDMQRIDAYYAKPRLLHSDERDVNGAFYVLTEECVSIFPSKADGFLNLNQIPIGEGFIQFYIYSEGRVADGLYDYDRFIQYVKDHGATDYDGDHLLIPAMSKADIEEMIASIR